MLWGIGLLVAALAIVALHDVLQRRRAILHNFPIVGHLRYLLEEIGPELRQYWVAGDKEELPFNRTERAWIYTSSKGRNNTFGFGTSEQLYGVGYPILKHKTFPFPEERSVHPGGDPSAIPSLEVLGAHRGRKKPFRPRSIVNVSAMSFGSLGERAVSALNQGAKKAGCYQNTGEGGISPYPESGADVVWQIGTGYFGARDAKGKFSMDLLADEVAKRPFIRAIEVKLSQGAKPGKGGILPGKKVTPQIAAIRMVEAGVDCDSPNHHSEFDSVDTMIDFIERIADRTGLPVGIKSAVGEAAFWEELARRVLVRKAGPDFITIDGGEGGTGAAPLTFTDHVSLPFKVGFARVYRIFLDAGSAREVTWIGSGKLGFPDRTVIALAMGCDLIHIAREAMMSIGCIQAQKCHTDFCPTGVATQNWWLQRGIDVADKSDRFATYVKTFRKELLSLSHACGYEHPSQFTGQDIEFSSGVNHFSTLDEVLDYRRVPVHFPGMAALAANPA